MAGLYCKNVLHRFGDIQRGDNATRARSLLALCSAVALCRCFADDEEKSAALQGGPRTTTRPGGQTRNRRHP